MEYPHIDPVAVSIGSLQVRWYGLMYIVAFALGWILARRRARMFEGWRAEYIDDLLTYAMIGIILGARLGYVLFYDLPAYIESPLEVFRVWNGGMSFHGGLIGVLIAFWCFARKYSMKFWDVADVIVPAIPQGLLWGRIGNFINAELWGKVTDVSWGMVFPGGGPLPRHPSQLYEAALEGVLLTVLLWWYGSRPRKRGAVAGLFALGYGLSRFLVEFVRMPDPQLGYLAFGWLTMGQVLCLPLIAIGAWLMLRPAPVVARLAKN